MPRPKPFQPEPAKAVVESTAAEAPSPDVKATFCAGCDARMLVSGEPLCPACLQAEGTRRTARAGYTRCHVSEGVCATGMLDDGRIKTTFAAGEVAEFADYDVLSVPGCLEEFEAWRARTAE